LFILSLALAWVSAGEEIFQAWGTFFVSLLLGLGIILIGWYAVKADRNLSLPRWLGILVLGAAVLRLAAGVIWFKVLPVWGYGSPVEQAGYIMADAHARDMAAWELAKSEVPLWDAFRGYRQVDQYGGLLYISALCYRYLGGEVHYPLQMIVITAAASALAVLFTWAFVRRAWGEAPARVSAWLVAVFPEAILLNSSTDARRSPCRWWLLLCTDWFATGRIGPGKGLAWVLFALILCLPFSPAFAAIPLTILIVTRWQWMAGRLFANLVYGCYWRGWLL
jgi:hypothetical protein